MIINSSEPEEESTPMIILEEEGIKVEENEYSNTESGAEDWSETETGTEEGFQPNTPALMSEIEEFVSRNEKRSRLAQLRQTRLEITKIQDELEDRANDKDAKDLLDEIEGEGSTGDKSDNEETG